MGTSEKIMHYANFNITYGPTEDPMLTHFEDIIWPAFLSDFKRGKKNEHPLFYLSDIALKEISGDMVLVGNYIKDTQYDIRTTVQNGELVSTPSSVPTAPYSRFIIFLKNSFMLSSLKSISFCEKMHTSEMKSNICRMALLMIIEFLRYFSSDLSIEKSINL